MLEFEKITQMTRSLWKYQLINLDYFTQVGMIDRNKLLKDLYGTTSGDLGYLYNLGKLNTTYTEASVKKDDKDGIAIQVSTSQELVKL